MYLLLNVSHTFARRLQLLSRADLKPKPRFPMVSPRSTVSDSLNSGVTNLLHLLLGAAKNEI
jgi:hypothetical protein